MTKPYIPELGSTFLLQKEWTFGLFHEDRNKGLFKSLGLEYHPWRSGPIQHRRATLPAGTTCILDRIYVRQGKGGFSSITLRIASWPDGSPLKGSPRFWVKLPEFNKAPLDVSAPEPAHFALSWSTLCGGATPYNGDASWWGPIRKAVIDGVKHEVAVCRRADGSIDFHEVAGCEFYQFPGNKVLLTIPKDWQPPAGVKKVYELSCQGRVITVLR
jgi:hypothetical protein